METSQKPATKLVKVSHLNHRFSSTTAKGQNNAKRNINQGVKERKELYESALDIPIENMEMPFRPAVFNVLSPKDEKINNINTSPKFGKISPNFADLGTQQQQFDQRHVDYNMEYDSGYMPEEYNPYPEGYDVSNSAPFFFLHFP